MQRIFTFAKAGLGLALALTAPATNAAPITAFSTFGPPGSMFASGTNYDGYIESGPTSATSPSYYSQGDEFSVSTSGALSTISIALTSISGTNDAHLFIANDSGRVPGAILESLTLTNLPKFTTSSYTPEIITSVNHPFLTAGTRYFLYEAETGDEDNSWNICDRLSQGFHTISTNGGPYSRPLAQGVESTPGAFSVQVDAVPEASTTVIFGLLLILGLCGSVLAARKKLQS